ARVVADESSRGTRATAKELDRGARLHSRRFLCGNAGAGDEVAGPGSERTGVAGKRHRPGEGRGEEREEYRGRVCQAQSGDRGYRAGEHRKDGVSVGRSDAVSGRRILAVSLQEIQGC